MSVKRVLCLLIATLMTAALLSGCIVVQPGETQAPQSSESAQQTTEKKEEQLPFVNLIGYFVGEEGKDHAEILGKINEVLKRDLNTSLHINIIPTADVNQKYPLIFASGEEFDLVFAAGWTGYKSQAQKGGYMELTDEMLKKYCPQTFESMEPINWKPVMVDDKKYMIPRTDYTFNPFTIVVRGDLRKKHNLPEIKSLADFENFLLTIAEKETNILAYGDNNAQYCWMLPTVMLNIPNEWAVLTSGGSDFMFFDTTDPTGENIFVREKTPEYLEWAKKMVEWRKKGVWSNSALTSKGGQTEQFEAGKSAAVIHHNLGGALGLYNKLKLNHPEWDVEVYDATFGKPVTYTIPIAGFALNANTKNPERALMVIEKFRTDRELYDYAQHGIKGKHYDLTPEGYTIPLPESGGYGNISYYGLRTGPMNRIPAETFPGYDEILKSCEQRQYFNPLQMFSLDSDPVKNEYAACKAIFDQTRPILNLGFADDVEAALKEYFDKMDAAGYQKLIEEETRQVREFARTF